jgi:hypothetical protein
MNSNVTNIKKSIEKENKIRMSDERVNELALDLSEFGTIFHHAFEVWEKMNDGYSDIKAAAWMKSTHSVDFSRHSMGRFRKAIVDKYGLLTKDMTDDFVQSIERRARMSVIPRVNAFEGFNASASFAEMVMLDTMDEYMEAMKTAKLPVAKQMAKGMAVDEMKESAVKRHKDAAIVYTNAVGNMVKLAGGEDVEFRDITIQASDEQREAVSERLSRIADRLAKKA